MPTSKNCFLKIFCPSLKIVQISLVVKSFVDDNFLPLTSVNRDSHFWGIVLVIDSQLFVNETNIWGKI